MKKFYFLLIAAMAFVACDTKEPTPNQSLKLLGEDTTELNFQGWADEVSITFSSPVNWMIEKDEDIDWFTVTPPYGVAGSATIHVEVFDYDGNEKHEGKFSIVAGNERIDFAITQMSSTDPNSEYVYIEDNNFAAYLVENFDDNNNGRIEKSEAAAVTRITCNDREIRSLRSRYSTAHTTLSRAPSTFRAWRTLRRRISTTTSTHTSTSQVAQTSVL